MNQNSDDKFETGGEAQPSPAFERLRDRRRARRTRAIRTALIVLLCVGMLAGAAVVLHRAAVQPYLNTPITADAPAQPEPDPEPAAEPAPEAAPLTFWQKLLKLFGLYKG